MFSFAQERVSGKVIDDNGKQQLLDVLVGLHGFLALALLWLL